MHPSLPLSRSCDVVARGAGSSTAAGGDAAAASPARRGGAGPRGGARSVCRALTALGYAVVGVDIDATHGYATVLTQFLLLTVSVLYYQGLLEIQSAIANPFGNDATDLSRRRERRIWGAEVEALHEAAQHWAVARGSAPRPAARRRRCCHFSSPHSILYGESP